jgi:DNA-binding CsgD family transcriptional regulator
MILKSPGFLAEIAQKYLLSKGELEVLTLLASGLDIQEIAQSINATVDVVRKRLSEIYKKLGIEGKPGPGGKLKELKKQLDQAQVDSQQRQLDGISPIYGREQDIAELNDWVNQANCRVLAILGIKGIGKTSLAATFFRQLQQEGCFERFFWISLCPPFEQFLADLLQQLQGQLYAADMPASSLGISKLLEYFRNYRCLVVIDQIDAILQEEQAVGYYREGYSLYGELIKRLGEEFHKSCIVIVSSENLPEIESFEEPELGIMLPDSSSPPSKQPSVRIKYVNSLASEAALNIVEKYMTIPDPEKKLWLSLIELYQGNPLHIKIATAFIYEFLAGDVATFLDQKTLVFGDIAILIEQQIKRLSKVEVEVAELLSRETQGITLVSITQKSLLKKQEIMTALQSLKRRSLLTRSVHQRQVSFGVHPLMIEYFRN